MKHQQLTFFDLQQYEQSAPTYDPTWDEIVLEQDTTARVIISDDSQKISGDRRLVVLEQDTSNPVPEQTVPEHLQWVEKYSPSKRKDNHYYRYCYKVRGKIQHRHISGGNVRSSIALARKQAIEEAIADGKSPADIEKIIHSWRELKK